MNAELVVVNNQVQLVKCSLYASHFCAIPEVHHVAPLSWWLHAGLPVQTPFATICPTCHMNTHTGIDGTIKGQDISLLPPRTRRLAAQAFTIAAQYGLTPTLTL